jgi:hypothetical protein
MGGHHAVNTLNAKLLSATQHAAVALCRPRERLKVYDSCAASCLGFFAGGDVE